MPLGLTVSLCVVGAVIVTALIGYMIDRSAEGDERK